MTETATEPISDQSPNRLIRWLGGGVRPSYSLTRWLFLRALGFIYFFAFASLLPQILGLIGSKGISPAADLFAHAGSPLQGGLLFRVPTLFWFSQSDGFLVFICGAGVVLSILVIFDILVLPALILLWAFYLSIIYVGQSFLSFQWDILLVEVGFLAIFLVPFYIVPRAGRLREPARPIIYLFRLLLFRLMIESGYVKLASGDPTWHNLTATTYHYWTQPLPTGFAWYINQLPLGFHQLEVLITFFVELLVPFLIFMPRRLRFLAAALIAGHQTMIWLTGNYTFFNFLTIVLCIPLLDDLLLQRLMPVRLVEKIKSAVNAAPMPTYQRVIVTLVTVVIVFLNVVQMGNVFTTVPAFARQLAQPFEPFFFVNNYGLFASMTTTRPEIIVEGSNDGTTWLAYEFPAKPGDLSRPPVWVAPYHPRLDWQLWFAALEGSPYVEGWFPNFVQRLLQGQPEVLALLAKNPFPDHPPRYIRAQLYEYHFTDFATRQRTGQWWERTFSREFLPSTSADSGS